MSNCPSEPAQNPVSIQALQETLLQLQAEKVEQEKFDANAEREKIKRFIQILEKGQKQPVEETKNGSAKKRIEQSLLKHIQPACSLITDGKIVSSIDSEALKGLQKFIIMEEGSKARAFDTLTVMSRWIEAGNEANYWQLCPPPLPVMIKAPVSPFSRGAWQKTSHYDELFQALERSLGRQEDIEKKGLVTIQLGQFLLSAVLLGDIHDQVSLKALMRRLGEPLCHAGDLCWLELKLVRPRQIGNELRRWFPDALTELFYYGLSEQACTLARDWAENDQSIKRLYRIIRQFLVWEGTAKTSIPASYTKLMDIVLYQRMLDSSALMAGFTGRKFISHSPRLDCWKRLMGGNLPEEDYHNAENNVEPDAKQVSVSEAKPDTVSAHSLLEPIWLHGFRQAVFGTKEQSVRSCAKACDAYLQTLSQPKTMRVFVSEWIHYLLTERRQIKGKLAVSTIKGFLSSTGKRLASVTGDIDITELDEAGFEDIYWQVLEDAQTNSLKRAIAKGLTEFHEFMVHRYGAPELQGSKAMGMGRSAVPVDANIISLDEYERILKRLLTYKALNTFHEELGLIAKLIVILGFRCGLRRSEVLKLRIADYHPGMRCELLIRPWSNRRLKTKSSTRKMPVHVLLTEAELQLLDQWVYKRLEQEKKTAPDELKNKYLFALPESQLESIPEEFLFRKIHHVMREVTQDKTLRFHHLRHSFATWTVMRLMLSDMTYVPLLFPKQPKTQKWLEQSGAFRKSLYLNSEITRKHLYAAASLLGHSGPDMSLEHYVHCLDLVSMLARKERVEFKHAIKVPFHQQSTLYKKAKDNLPRLLQLARANYRKKGRAEYLVRQQRQPVWQEGAELEDKISGYEVMEDLYTFLSMYLNDGDLDVKSLGQRFGYRAETSIAYIDQLVCLSDKLQSGTRVLPLWRLNDDDEEEFREVANQAYALMEEKSDYVTTVCDFYAENVWRSRRGLIFKKQEVVEAAKRYVGFLNEIGIEEARLELSFFKGTSTSQIKFWRSNLGLNNHKEKLNISPQNKKSPGIRNAVRIKVRALNPQQLDETSEAPYVRLLMFLLRVLAKKEKV